MTGTVVRKSETKSNPTEVHCWPLPASLLTISSTLWLFFQSLFHISFMIVFSFRRSLSPNWGCILRQPDSLTVPRGVTGYGPNGLSPSPAPLSKGLGQTSQLLSNYLNFKRNNIIHLKNPNWTKNNNNKEFVVPSHSFVSNSQLATS